MCAGPNAPNVPQIPPGTPGYVERYTNQVVFPGKDWSQGTVKQIFQMPDRSVLKDKVRSHPVGTCGHPIENVFDLVQCCSCEGICCRAHASTPCGVCNLFFCPRCARQLETVTEGVKKVTPVCLRCYVDKTTWRIVKFIRKTDKYLFDGGG